MRQNHRTSLLLLVLLRQTLSCLAYSRRPRASASARTSTARIRGAGGGTNREGANTDPRRSNVQTESCEIACHVVRPEVMGAVDATGGDDMDSPYEVSAIDCIPLYSQQESSSRRSRRRAVIPLLGLTGNENVHEDELEAGSLHLCITQPFWTDDGSIDLSTSGRYKWLDASSLIVDDRSLQQQQLQPPLRPQSIARSGVKTLLAIRVIADGVEPVETLADMEGTIFGTGAKAIVATVVAQYQQMSHGKLRYEPLTLTGNSNVQNGVMELTMPKLLGVNVQGSFTELMLNKTQDILLGADSTGTLEDAVDNIIFCLPDGGLFKGSTEWTAFTYLFEPYSYYQKERCTRLSVGT
jgi:hypothetical protein